MGIAYALFDIVDLAYMRDCAMESVNALPHVRDARGSTHNHGEYPYKT